MHPGNTGLAMDRMCCILHGNEELSVTIIKDRHIKDIIWQCNNSFTITRWEGKVVLKVVTQPHNTSHHSKIGDDTRNTWSHAKQRSHIRKSKRGRNFCFRRRLFCKSDRLQWGLLVLILRKSPLILQFFFLKTCTKSLGYFAVLSKVQSFASKKRRASLWNKW